MIGFILSAVVLVLLALLFVVPVLLKKNHPYTEEYDELNVSIAKDRLNEIKQQREADEITEEAYQQLRNELEATLALDLTGLSQNETPQKEMAVATKNKLIPFVLAASIPVVSAGIYSQIGNFDAATGQIKKSVSIPEGTNRPQMTIEEAVAKLEQRLVVDPNNSEGWFMLAKTHMSMRQYAKAKLAYEKTIELVGEEAELLLRYADAVAMTEGGNLTGTARPIVEKVMALIPDNPTVLWMAGTSESQLGNYSKALGFWYKLRPMLANQAESLAQLNQLISEAEARLSKAEVAALKQAVPANEVQPATSTAEITVTVDLDPGLKARVSANDTLFIFAKALQGPPMPLAAVKETVASLPLTVTLNDAMAMMPQMKLSNFKQVKVSAVISKSGQPGAQPGDLFAEVSPVSVNSQARLSLLINQTK